MKRCNVWMNGENVGSLQIRESDGRAQIQCHLPDGWIYRAKLFTDENVAICFGVLLPENGIFTTTAFIPIRYIVKGELHCEIQRMVPGETHEDGDWITFYQSEPWIDSAFFLEETLLHLVRKKDTRYRVYCGRRYLLFPVKLDESDSMSAIYSAGKAMHWSQGWFLCVEIDESGKIIFWSADEN